MFSIRDYIKDVLDGYADSKIYIETVISLEGEIHGKDTTQLKPREQRTRPYLYGMRLYGKLNMERTDEYMVCLLKPLKKKIDDFLNNDSSGSEIIMAPDDY